MNFNFGFHFFQFLLFLSLCIKKAKVRQGMCLSIGPFVNLNLTISQFHNLTNHTHTRTRTQTNSTLPGFPPTLTGKCPVRSLKNFLYRSPFTQKKRPKDQGSKCTNKQNSKADDCALFFCFQLWPDALFVGKLINWFRNK